MDTTRPFLRQEGLAAGLTKRALDGRAFHSMFGSVRLAAAKPWTTVRLAQAALLLVPHRVISHHTAAELWGGIVPVDGRTHLSVAQAKDRRRRVDLCCHVNPSAGYAKRQGLPLTSPERTFCDMAAHLGLVELVVLGDSLVRVGVTTPQALAQAAAGGRSVRAKEAACLVRERVESPMETRVRLMIVLAGLPEPTVNLTVRLRGGRVVCRIDLAWESAKLGVEYDGRHHAADAQQWGHDLQRREALDGAGWRLIVLRSTDVYTSPWAAICRIVEALSQRGLAATVGCAPPPRFRRHFPGRPGPQQVT